MCQPGIEQGELSSVIDSGLRIVVDCSTSFHRVPLYQRYRWEWMDTHGIDCGACFIINAFKE
jgi:hypothetical protein